MGAIGWILLGFILGYILSDYIKKPRQVYNYIFKRNKANKNGNLSISSIDNMPNEKQMRDYVLNNPDKGRRKIFDRENKRKLKKLNYGMD